MDAMCLCARFGLNFEHYVAQNEFALESVELLKK